MSASEDARWMAAAIALATRGRGLSTPNPNVGCVIVSDGHVVGRGWTQDGGRPHAEAMALAQAGEMARGASAYATLEPCAHESPRGPACADALIAAGVARVVAATQDPDPRTNGAGLARLAAAGIVTEVGLLAVEARAAMAGWWSRATLGRAHVTLKLATSLDGCIATASGASRWITGDRARAHAHLLRARSDAILVGRGTWAIDAPKLDVRLAGLEARAPQRLVLSQSSPERGGGPVTLVEGQVQGYTTLSSPAAATTLPAVNDLLVEGGAGAAAAFLADDLVDTLLLYRAPILIGGGRASLGNIGLTSLADAHGRWRLVEAWQLGTDRVETYSRNR